MNTRTTGSLSQAIPAEIDLRPSTSVAMPLVRLHLGRALAPIRSALCQRAAAALSTVANGSSPLRNCCIVGAGPGGFYTAKYLLKADPDVRIDIVEKLPTPFGLVRSGVAPDHQDVKSVQNDFSAVAEDERVRYFGNVSVGDERDADGGGHPSITLDALREHYSAVVLAYGAEGDKELGICGEDLSGVHAARAFVNWYNGHPDFVGLEPDLACETALIVGQGNVAVDCARILAKTPAELASSDIARHAQEVLASSRIRRVVVAGRRGHVQASFTMKELRELTKLDGASFVVRESELEQGLTEASAHEISETRAKKRMDALLRKQAAVAPDSEDNSQRKALEVRFLLNPVEFLADSADNARVGAVRLERTMLSGAPFNQSASGTGEFEEFSCGLVLRSIGYRSAPLASTLPFDDNRAVVRNERGRVEPGLYCAGWVKRGPTGIIGTNIPDARETVEAIIGDAEAGALSLGGEYGESPLVHLAKDETRVVTWDDFRRIDQSECAAGAAQGKPREKIVDVHEMLRVAKAT